jgi:hypothetical protein
MRNKDCMRHTVSQGRGSIGAECLICPDRWVYSIKMNQVLSVVGSQIGTHDALYDYS